MPPCENGLIDGIVRYPDFNRWLPMLQPIINPAAFTLFFHTDHRVRGHRDNRYVWILRTDQAGRSVSVHNRHMNIHQDQIRLVAVRFVSVNTLLPVIRCGQAESCSTENALRNKLVSLVIFHQQKMIRIWRRKRILHRLKLRFGRWIDAEQLQYTVIKCGGDDRFSKAEIDPVIRQVFQQIFPRHRHNQDALGCWFEIHRFSDSLQKCDAAILRRHK